MYVTNSDDHPALRQRILVFCLAIIILLTRFWGSPEIRDTIRAFFDYPDYEGMWAAFEHVFLYTTFTAILCILFWYILYKKQLFPPIKSYFIFNRKVFIYGTISGLSIVFFNITIAFLLTIFTDSEGLIGLDLQSLGDYWLIFGNIFSNFYEELIYSVFLLLSFKYAFKKYWIAIILTGLVFGFIHAQYPIHFRLALSIAGFVSSWVVIKTNSIWAAWLCHMLMDVLMDLFFIQT